MAELRTPGNFVSLNVRFDGDPVAVAKGRDIIRKAKMYASRDGHRLRDFVERALVAEIERAEKRK